MRYLIINIFFIAVSCTSYVKKKKYDNSPHHTIMSITNPYFSDVSKDYVYKAKIKVYSKSFSGIFIVKKLGKHNHRVVFTTEMGSKIFDFSFYNDEFKVNYVLDELDKKILLNILEKDFRVLVRESEFVISEFEKMNSSLYKTQILNNTYYYEFSDGNNLTGIYRVSNSKEKVQFLFSDIHEVTAKNIQILHKNIKLDIILKSIN